MEVNASDSPQHVPCYQVLNLKALFPENCQSEFTSVFKMGPGSQDPFLENRQLFSGEVCMKGGLVYNCV